MNERSNTAVPNAAGGEVNGISRREFVRASALAATTPLLVGGQVACTGGSDTIRVGLIGCGGRGPGAVGNALEASPRIQLVALADELER